MIKQRGQMRAVVLQEIRQAPRLIRTPPPVPGRDEVLIDVAACGLNFADLLMIEGKYQERAPLPLILGMEVAGTVHACGPDVTGLEPGMRVAAFTGKGGLAEQVTCPATRCLALPDSMSMTTAAGFLVAYGTSHLALLHRAQLRPGETLVVLGAAGGVGLTAVEIGAAMGARVIAAARGPEKAQVARAAGAAVCIDSNMPDMRAALRDLGGADVIFDAIGEPLATPALRALRPEGRFLAIGFAGGKVPQFPANILLVKNLTVIGLYWGGYLDFAPERMMASLQELIQMQQAGRLRPHVSHVLPLERFSEGLDLLRSRQSTGKVVITL